MCQCHSPHITTSAIEPFTTQVLLSYATESTFLPPNGPVKFPGWGNGNQRAQQQHISQSQVRTLAFPGEKHFPYFVL